MVKVPAPGDPTLLAPEPLSSLASASIQNTYRSFLVSLDLPDLSATENHTKQEVHLLSLLGSYLSGHNENNQVFTRFYHYLNLTSGEKKKKPQETV